MIPDASFAPATVALNAGDTLLLYTDGVTDAHTTTRAGRYSDEELLAYVTARVPATAPETVAALTDLLTGFGAGLDDDAAVMALGVPARTDNSG